MKILVTGAAGHIGASLILKIADNYEVLGIDNFSNYYSPQYKEKRIKALNINEIILNVDIRDCPKTEKTIKAFNPDVIIHLAARPGVRAKWDQISEYAENNIQGFLNIIKIAKENKVKKFIYASSSSVYTSENSVPFSEESTLYFPRSYYALSKQTNEMAAKYFASDDFKVIGLRFFTVYGPWGRPDMAVLQFIGNALLGEKSYLKASLDNLRDFTYVDDVTNLICEVINLTIKNSHEVFNVGGSTPRSLKELINILHKHGVKPDFTTTLISGEDIKSTNASTKKLNSFGLSIPSINLETGIEKTMEWVNNTDKNLLLNTIRGSKL